MDDREKRSQKMKELQSDGLQSKADHYEQRSKNMVLRYVMTGWNMFREQGIQKTYAQARMVFFWKLHDKFVDGPAIKRFPQHNYLRPVSNSDMSVHTSHDFERTGAKGCQHTSSFLLRGMLRYIDIDYGDYSFIDIGSGFGYAVIVAAEFPFQRAQGVEFARELHVEAEANLEWAGQLPTTRCKNLASLHESALTATFPRGPLVLFLFNPFDEVVTKAFVERVAAHAKSNPSVPIYLLYANPLHGDIVAQAEGAKEMQLTGAAGLKIKLLSAIKGRIFHWNA